MDVYRTWNGTNLDAVKIGTGRERQWTNAVKTGMGADMNVSFDDVTMFVTGDALYAVDRRTGGCRSRHQNHRTVLGPSAICAWRPAAGTAT